MNSVALKDRCEKPNQSEIGLLILIEITSKLLF